MPRYLVTVTYRRAVVMQADTPAVAEALALDLGTGTRPLTLVQVQVQEVAESGSDEGIDC